MASSSAIQAFDKDPNVEVARTGNIVVGLDHLQQPWSPSPVLRVAAVGEDAQPTAENVARQYLLETAEAYGIPTSFFHDTQARVVEGTEQSVASPGLELAEERARFQSTAVTYQQTLSGYPVWDATFSVTLNDNLQVMNSISSVKPDATEPRKPPADAKFLKDFKPLDDLTAPLRKVLGLRPSDGQITINKSSLFVYQYDKNKRQDLPSDHGDRQGDHFAPTLILNEVPDSIQNGRYYVVREVLFTLPLSGYGELNWDTLIEVETGAILYLRALTAGISRPAEGWIFSVDPITRVGASAPRPTSDTAELNRLNLLREKVVLPNILRTSPQTLKGTYVEIKEFSLPLSLPPTSSTGQFDYNVDADGFAAVNAYHHITRVFALLGELGFNVLTFFDATSLPVPVDHRALGDRVNAQAPGTLTGDGSGGFIFGRADANSKIGIAADFRIAAHEFGHALLWEAVRSPNFGFAHSAGDALGAILSDPGSQCPDRFDTFPWNRLVRRRHDRDVADSWAWDGPEAEDEQYPSEQILSTTLFRIYRAIGGDAIGDVQRQKWASHYTLYLIFGGIGKLTTPSRTANQYASFMQAADSGRILGPLNYPGGAVRKIVRWAFEKQGLYQQPPPTQPWQNLRRGAAPFVDVYINDGRVGEYDYLADFDDAPGIWNRQASDSGRTNQTPALGVRNYIYVAVQNRGLQQARNIQVTVYVSTVATPQTWDPNSTSSSFNTVATINLAPIPSGGSADAGPFEWTPDPALPKHSILASVSADSDLSIIDPRSGLDVAVGPVDLDKLVPFDNNLALRTV